MKSARNGKYVNNYVKKCFLLLIKKIMWFKAIIMLLCCVYTLCKHNAQEREEEIKRHGFEVPVITKTESILT